MKPKTLFKLLPVFFMLSFAACSKKNNTPDPPPPPVILPDTLSAGWSKTIVGGKDFTDIFFQNNTIGYAITNALYKTINGGITWDSVNVKISRTPNLSVTTDGKILYPSNDTIYRSIDGGNSFSAFKTNTSPGNDIFFVSNEKGFASSGSGNLLGTVDGGISWQIVANVSNGFSGGYSSLYFISETDGWMTMGSSVYKSNAGLSNWIKAAFIDGPTNLYLNLSIYASSASIVYTGSSNGVIYKSTDGGLNFSSIKKLTGIGGYLDLHFINNETVMPAMTNGFIKPPMEVKTGRL